MRYCRYMGTPLESLVSISVGELEVFLPLVSQECVVGAQRETFACALPLGAGAWVLTLPSLGNRQKLLSALTDSKLPF